LLQSQFTGAAPRPVLFIGLDGAEPRLIERWIDEGELPNLANVQRNSHSGPVETFRGFGDGATWPSLVTGVTPARHGRYFRRQFHPRSYRRKLYDVDTELSNPPFWTTLGRAGRRVAVLDVPYARCEPDINGLLLVDWYIHDRYGEPRGWPPSLAQDVIDAFGDDPVRGNSDVFLKWHDHDYVQLAEQLETRARNKARLVSRQFSEGGWDLVATAFTEPHDLGHAAWHLHDPSHPQHDPAWLEQHGDPMKRLYVALDESIGEIISAAPANTSIVVFAGLGMGPNYTANGVMSRILARLDGRPEPARSPVKRLQQAGWPRGLLAVARKLAAAREMVELSRRRFFAMDHNENSGALRVNLEGREPFGRVAVSAFERTCDELTSAFMEIKNCANGRPVVAEVVRVARELAGERIDELPDLLVVWNRETPFDAIESPLIGRIDQVRSWGRTGDHTANAMLMVQDPRVPPGPFTESPRIVDIPATIAALQGVMLPDCDGRPMYALESR
jgi:predicted AlkP superfamily phosphohydrolase/phosphomutase